MSKVKLNQEIFLFDCKKCTFKGVFTIGMFGWIKTNTGAIDLLVRFI